MEDFVSTYMALHGLDPAQGLFQYLDVLLFVEATIYQMDEENEAVCEGLADLAESSTSSAAAGEQLGGLPGVVTDICSRLLLYALPNLVVLPLVMFVAKMSAGYDVLVEVLEQQQLLSNRVREELELGQQYWQQERHICSYLAHTRPGQDVHLTLADILSAHEAKSFDYRVLHLLLHELLNQPYNELLLQFMRVDEMLVDIGDDLTDYEDDVMANSFNVYRGFIHLYGRAAPEKLIERIGQLEAERERLLVQLPVNMQQHVLKRQREAAVEEGADKWVFPDPILDEPKYRQTIREVEGGRS
eukprot:gene3202-3479_t